MTQSTARNPRELLNLLQILRDETASGSAPPGQGVPGGPYRRETETLVARLAEEKAQVRDEVALLEERLHVLEALSFAMRPPPRFPTRLFRTLAFGAVLGACTAMTTVLTLLAPHLPAASAPVALVPPLLRDLASGPGRSAAGPTPMAPMDGARLDLAVTQLNDHVWDVDRRLLTETRLRRMTRDLAVVPERAVGDAEDGLLGARLYGVRRGSFADRLGLENGDVLLAINGMLVEGESWPVSSLTLEHETRLELSLLRRGEPTTFTYLLR